MARVLGRAPAPVRVRRMRAEDVAACASMIATERLWQRYELDAARARRMLRAALRRREELYVATRAGRVAGFLWIRTEGTFSHSGYIRLIGVAADVRRAGIGRVLLEFAERRIFRRGPNVFLLVSDFNRAAQQFYRRQGYARVGALADYVQSGITEYVYRKTRGPIARTGGGRS